MVGRHLLIAHGGGSSFAAPAVRDLAEVGAWSDEAHPRAAYYNGKTYLVWVNDAGHIFAAGWDNATKTLSTPVDLGTTTSVKLQASTGSNNVSILKSAPFSSVTGGATVLSLLKIA